jgi:hypothetical protein
MYLLGSDQDLDQKLLKSLIRNRYFQIRVSIILFLIDKEKFNFFARIPFFCPS